MNCRRLEAQRELEVITREEVWRSEFGPRIKEKAPEGIGNSEKETGLMQSYGIGTELIFQGLGFQKGTLFQPGQ